MSGSASDCEMMVANEDHIALAAEYALGTLDAEERAQAEAMMAEDAEFAALVDAWSQRLGSLNQMVGSVEPRPEVWDRIREAAGLSGAQMPLLLPESAAAVEPTATESAVAPEAGHVVAFAAPARGWRTVTAAMSALAAALIALVETQAVRTHWLPEGMRAKPRTEIVRVEPPTR